jgi:lipopolysaccharide export system permease protein
MSKITIYLARTIILMTILIFCIVIGIYFVFTFLAKLGDVGQGNYGVLAVIYNVLLTVPWSMNLIFPIVAMIGSLMGLSLLAQNSELVAMRASGVSWIKVSKAVLLVGVLFAFLSFFVGSYIAPRLNHIAALDEQVSKRGENVYVSKQSLWLKDGHDFILIENMTPGYHGVLHDISRYHVENGELKSILQAKDAIYKDKHWNLSNVVEIQIGTANYHKKQYDNLIIQQLIAPRLLKLLADSSSVDNLTLNQLLLVINYRLENKMGIAQYQITFWKMIFQPISIIVLMFAILPYVFMATHRSSYAIRLFVGAVIGFAFFVFNQFFSQLFLVYDIYMPAFLVAALPSVSFFLLTLFLIRLQKNV